MAFRIRLRCAGVLVRFKSFGDIAMANVKPIPEGYHTVTPYLIIRGAKEALEFYAKAFGAEEIFRMVDDKGRIGHAEMKIGNSMIMLAEEHEEMGHKSPLQLGSSS